MPAPVTVPNAGVLTSLGGNTTLTPVLPAVLLQSAIPVMIVPSGYMQADGTFIIGQTPTGSATATISNTVNGTSQIITFSAATLLGTAVDVGRVLTVNDGGTYRYFTITTQSSTTVAIGTISGGPFTAASVTLSGVTITGTGGQFSATITGTLLVGQSITLSGTYGGTGSITGYSNPTTYYVSATNGTSTFTLQTMALGAIVTTAGTPTGITYTVNGTAAIASTAGSTTGTWLSGALSIISTNSNTTAFSVPLPSAFSAAYAYFPTSSPLGTSGTNVFYTIMTTTTVGKAYNNVLSATSQPAIISSPTAFSSLTPAVYTQSTGTIPLVGVTVPANTMGVNGSLLYTIVATIPDDAGNKRISPFIGAGTSGQLNVAAFPSIGVQFRTTNAGVANSQIGCLVGVYPAPVGASSQVLYRTSVATTSDQTASIQGLIATTTDFIVLESYSIQVYPN